MTASDLMTYLERNTCMFLMPDAREPGGMRVDFVVVDGDWP